MKCYKYQQNFDKGRVQNQFHAQRKLEKNLGRFKDNTHGLQFIKQDASVVGARVIMDLNVVNDQHNVYTLLYGNKTGYGIAAGFLVWMVLGGFTTASELVGEAGKKAASEFANRPTVTLYKEPLAGDYSCDLLPTTLPSGKKTKKNGLSGALPLADTNFTGDTNRTNGNPNDTTLQTTQKDTNNVTINANDSNVTKTVTKKKMRWAQNPLGVDLDDFAALSPQEREEFIRELMDKNSRLLPHKKYKNDPSITYQEWLSELESCVQVLDSLVSANTELKKEMKQDDSVKTTPPSKTLKLDGAPPYDSLLLKDSLTLSEKELEWLKAYRQADSVFYASKLVLADEVVIELVAELPETGKGNARGDYDFKREIAYVLLTEFGKLVQCDTTQRESKYKVNLPEIKKIYKKIFDKEYVVPAKPTPAKMFYDLFLTLVVVKACRDSYDKSYYDQISKKIFVVFSEEDRDAAIKRSVRDIMGLFMTLEFYSKLQKGTVARFLSSWSEYYLTVPSKIQDKVDKMAARIGEIYMDISDLSDIDELVEFENQKEKLGKRIGDLRQDIGDLIAYLVENGYKYAKIKEGDAVDWSWLDKKVFGWLEKSYKELVKHAEDYGVTIEK